MNPTKQDPTYAPTRIETQSILTDREREILLLIGKGLKTGAIAKKLFLSIKTIESHRANMRRKLELASAFCLTAFAVRYVIEHVEKR